MSRKHKENWELDSVVMAVKSEVETRERSGIRPTTDKPASSKRPFPGTGDGTASALMTGEGKEFSCLFCKGNDQASGCVVVTNIEERKAILRKQGWCFICLRSASHLAHNCDSKIQRLGRGGRHHLAVCDAGRARHSDGSAVEGASTQSEAATSAMHVSSSMHVFLQTAQVTISRPEAQGTKSLNIHAIFDTRDQRLYVFQGVVNALKLEKIKTEKLRIATSGDKKQELQAVNLVELASWKPETGFEVTLNAFSLPHISSDLQGQDLSWVKENYLRYYPGSVA